MSTAIVTIDVDPGDRPVVRPLGHHGLCVRVEGDLGGSSLLFRTLDDARAWAREVVAQLDRLGALDAGTDYPDPLDVVLDQAHAAPMGEVA